MTDNSSPDTLPAETVSARSSTDHVTEYVISWKWLIGGLLVFLCCGSAIGGLYYYRSTHLAEHVRRVATQMIADADVMMDKARKETDETVRRSLFEEARNAKLGAAKLLDNFNRAQESHLPILVELNAALESLYKDEGGADSPSGRARSKQIMDNCSQLLQAIANNADSLPYRIRLMELAWDRNDRIEVLNRAREVLDVTRSLNRPENREALRYVALASLDRLPIVNYNPIQLQMPYLEEKLDSLLEKIYLADPSDIEIANRYAEFIIDVNRETFKKCASDKLLRETTPEQRKAMATSIINDVVSRNPNNATAYLKRFLFRVRFFGEQPQDKGLDPDLRKVLEIAPTNALGLTHAAMYSFEQMRRARTKGDEALAEESRKAGEEFLKQTIAHNRLFGLGYQYYGDYLVENNRLDEAIKVWDDGLEHSRHIAPEELAGRLVVTSIQMKRFEDAERYINKLNALKHDSLNARPNATKQIQNMMTLLTARLNAAEGGEALAKAEQSQTAGQDKEASRLFTLARNKMSDASIGLDSLLKTFGSPTDYATEQTSIYHRLVPESLMLAGKLMADQTKWSQAARYFEVAMPFPTIREAATIAAANAHQQMGQTDDAVRLLNNAVQRSPNNLSLRYLYMRTLFQQQMNRNDITPEALDTVEKQLRILEEHRAELEQPWTIDLRLIQLEMFRETLTNDPERILEAQLAATRKYRELENKELPARPGDPAGERRVYSDELAFLNDLANVYRALAALSDFDRVLSKMREMPNGETAYFAAKVNDALGRNDREGAKLVIEEAMESGDLTSEQRQRFVLLMRNLNEDSTDSVDRIYNSLKASYEINPDQIKPQGLFLMANMAIDRDDFEHAKVLQARLERIEGAPEEGTWWRYIKARLMLLEPEPDYEEIRQLQEAIVIRDDRWDLAYLLRATIEESFFAKNPENLESRARMLESLQMAIRCGNMQPAVWNKLLALYEEDNRTEDVKQLRRDALVRNIQLDARAGQFPQPYQRMCVQVQKSIQDEDPQNADIVARQCIVLAENRRESSQLIFSLNMFLGSIFFEAQLLGSAERHLEAVAKRGGSFVYPMAVCLAKDDRIDEGFALILDEIDRMPSSIADLLPSMLILLSQVRPSEEIFLRMDKLMQRIERGERLTLRKPDSAPAEMSDIPLGERRIRSMVLRFPDSEATPDPADAKVFPFEEEDEETRYDDE